MGHTLVDNFFTLWGLLGAGQVLELLLDFPVRALVAIIGVLGLFIAIARSSTAPFPFPLLSFFLVNVGVFLFFSTLASLSSTEVRSWAEQVGAELDPDVKASLEQIPADTSTTSLGLALSVRAIGAIVRGVVELVNEDFIAAPMAVTRAVVTGMTFDIGDPALRKKADAFKLECYTPAVQMYVDQLNKEDALTKENLAPGKTWPGAPEIVQFYNAVNRGYTTPSGDVIQGCQVQLDELLTELKKPNGEVDRMKRIFEASDMLKTRGGSDEEYLQLIFSNYLRSSVKRRDSAIEQATETLAELPKAAATAVSTLFDFVWLGTKSVQVATFGPYVQGAALGMLLYVFPLILSSVLIPGGGRIVMNYFLVIFWLRSWSVGWALADQASTVVAGAMWAEAETFAENIAHLFGGLTVITSILYLLSPPSPCSAEGRTGKQRERKAQRTPCRSVAGGSRRPELEAGSAESERPAKRPVMAAHESALFRWGVFHAYMYPSAALRRVQYC